MLHLGLVLGGSPALCLPLQQDRSVLTSNQGQPPNCTCSTDQQGGGLPQSRFSSQAEPCRLHRKSLPIPMPWKAVAFPGTLVVALRTKAAQGFAQKMVPNAGPTFLGVRMVYFSHL